MKILVTGATGFIGASLVRALLQRDGNEVYITARKTSDFWRIKDCLLDSRNTYYCNLENRNETFNLIRNIQPDIIYHTAAYGGLPNQTETDRIISANLNATINLLDAARSCGVQQFINTGSSSEYGIKDQPMKESDLCEPVNIYGITKLAATNYCRMMGQIHHYNVCTLRLFSPYGDLEDSKRLYPCIIHALKNNERAKLSKPNSVRDFIEINKVIEVYEKIIHVNYEPGDIINIGSGRQQTIAQFYTMLAHKLKKNIEPIWGEAPPRSNEPRHWEADISKLNLLMRLNEGVSNE
ncbi:NAD-dependent epimerase/dehydratase family protein [Paenibacillus chibensis]|uniref:NAD-dependent epimerase/dehydratase family protein n=1 Tax=Paenibacillus chibensis TaxID=59846 RepID=UPI000FD6D75C|nr:NAD(P)-dependent oxidoreductase [Paenibacillus chibensis]MEC0370788.1 NAD(P)-dependent oxidoreductase [Paenibacillus chibensis]